MSEKRTRLTAYIVAEYGTEVLEQIKNGTKQVLFNGTIVQYNEKFRDKRVTKGTIISINDFIGVILREAEKGSQINEIAVQIKELDERSTFIGDTGETLVENPAELPQGGKLDENCYLSPEPFATQSDVSPEEEEILYQAEIAIQRQHENLPVKDPVEITTENNNEPKANIEISPATKEEPMVPEDEEHFEDRFKEAKLIIEMHESGINKTTISSRMRIAETRISEIINQGIEETEIQLRSWYKVPKGKGKETKEPAKSKEPVKEEITEEPVVEAPAKESTSGKTRIKGGVKLAEEAIVAMLKEKPMTPKDLKAAAVEGVNPSTWVIRISKLKGAGKITLGADGMYTAV